MSEQKWIPVKKKLPEAWRDVLVTDGEEVSIGYRYLSPPETKWSDALDLTEVITHWQPIPEPPKQ